MLIFNRKFYNRFFILEGDIMKKYKLAIISAVFLTLSSSVACAATFGNKYSGASSVETMQVRYTGSAWNYKKSRYKSTYFKYVRGSRTLLYRFVSNGKVTGSVWDDMRWGNKYTTRFYWGHGALK